MRKRNKNIYMGPDSTAKLPVFGKVDTDNEICLNAIATAYDALNNKMLTRKFGVYDKTTLTEINGRFSVLRLLCRNYAPNKLNLVNKIQDIVTNHFKGHLSDSQALSMLQQVSNEAGLNSGVFNIAALHINQAEQMNNFAPFGIDLFMFSNNNTAKYSKKNRKRGIL